MTQTVEYSIAIPIEAKIEVDVQGPAGMTYEELLMSVTDVDLKEASLHIPQEQIVKAFIQAIAHNNISIKKTP